MADIQLKIRTEYTFGETFSRVEDAVQELARQGCKAAGIVDKDSTWGHVSWHSACRQAGIKPMLGADMVVSDEDDHVPRMWFLARNVQGLQELYRATSKAHTQRVKSRYGSTPRLYRADVEAMSDNILKFAGDIDDADFLASCNALLDKNPSSRIRNAKLSQIAGSHSLTVVQTSDNYTATEDDKSMLGLMSWGAGRMTPQHILPDLGEQDAAQRVADMVEDFDLPVAPMVRATGDLEKLCRAGAKRRNMNWTQVYEDRLQKELELIRSKDFDSYFLIVADMTEHAKGRMVVGPSRGSAAGSLVCYLTGITEIDPIPPGLFFERFIAANRKDLPDIDLDFPAKKRHLVFEYMEAKYGIENVAHIGTVGRYRAKSALAQVCKKLRIPALATVPVKIAMIERSSADSRASNCLEDTLKTTDPGRHFLKMYPNAILASRIEGHASHSGVHAAGLIVCNEPITNYATVDENDIAHIDMDGLEKLGLLKIDVLGLRTLDVLEDSGVDLDWYNLPLDDPAALGVFSKGALSGIFQFEGNALREISKQIGDFKSIDDIDAVTALARPGPFGGGVTAEYLDRRQGKEYDPIHPLVQEHMAGTYGLPVYQEQTLAIVREIGRFDWDETSTIRKAMSKVQGKEFFDSFWPKFKSGASSIGIGESEARTTWELINAMGAWQMNRAHTYSYAVVSYWTAYLKAHHPVQFAAATLRNAKDDDSALMLLREMVKEGLEYVPFCPKRSKAEWSVQDGVLWGGFESFKGVGKVTAAKMVEKRDSGKWTDEDTQKILARENIFKDIFPFRRLYRHLYEDPRGNNVAGDVHTISDFDTVPPHRSERVFLAELIYKNPRDANEEINVKRRGGGLIKGEPTNFLDVRLRDDTGTIGGRISRWDYARIGKELFESVPIGAHLMIRAAFYNDIRYAFIKKWKRIDGNDS